MSEAILVDRDILIYLQYLLEWLIPVLVEWLEAIHRSVREVSTYV